ncbi:hypothetical protein HU200_012935 [Digitaria exilis]|uniref:Cathepsin propeptide inhibitor domain-containing protein n=1 Tax=Digitaria exilis TaxID=1010633 RepID=A0A835FEI0_9POAL|nr:hypothetical protein HU200_012935 [Digitaria exilis]
MRGSTAALMAAALLTLLVSPAVLMLLLSPAASDTYEQETRRMFVQWKAKYKIAYKYAGEEECRYALFKHARRTVARSNAAGVTTSGLNGLSAHASEEIFQGEGFQIGEESYEEESRRMFVGWKAKYKKIYRDVGEEECRYALFKGNRRIVVKLNAVAAAAAGEKAYGLNEFGDLTMEEVRERCDSRGGETEGKLSAMCQAAVAEYPGVHHRPIWSLVCHCIALELKQAESGGSTIPGDEAHMQI